MTLIGLTGGIASGKSVASEMLAELGATIIDADRLGHRSYEPGTPGFQKVVNAFGHDIVDADGNIDRRVLGGKVFGAPGELDRLNAIVWPEIRILIKEEVKQIRQQEEDPIIVLEAAVLLEAKWEDLCDEIWVVTTPVKTAVERLKERNGLTEEASMARINAQMSNKERAAAADVKIENASTTDELRVRVERAWKALQARRARAARKAGGSTSGGKATKTGSRKSSSSAKPATKASTSKSTTAAAGRTTRAASARAGSTKAAGTKPATTEGPPTTKKAAAKPSKAQPGAKAAAKKAPTAKSPARTAGKSSSAKSPASKAGASGSAAKKATTGKSASRAGNRSK